ALLVLALSMILIDLGEVAHPGIATLPTVLASMALLWFARPGEGVTRALSLAPMVHIGKLSYSLYLWHFPIFAFGRLASVEAPGALDYGIWLGLTYVASRLGYHLVERRFRFDVKGFLFAGSLASALAVLGAFVLIVKQTDLLIGPRASDVAALYGENEIDNAALRDLSWQPLMTLKGEDLATIRDARGKPTEADISKLTFAEGTELNVLVLGNSHAKDFFNALYLNAAAFEGLGFSRFGIQAGFSRRERDLLYASPDFARADVILIAPRYARRDAEVLGEFIDELRARGKNVGVVGNTAQFVSPGTVPIYDWFVQRHQTRPDPARLAQIAFASEESEPRRRNAALRTVAEAHGAVYFSRRDLMCDEAARGCALTTPEGRKTMFDYGHWTLEGARYFGSLVAEQGWLAQFERP
ncbi:MAG: acyltransferase family protein, partial [Pseudomonadota bacterium]